MGSWARETIECHILTATLIPLASPYGNRTTVEACWPWDQNSIVDQRFYSWRIAASWSKLSKDFRRRSYLLLLDDKSVEGIISPPRSNSSTIIWCFTPCPEFTRPRRFRYSPLPTLHRNLALRLILANPYPGLGPIGARSWNRRVCSVSRAPTQESEACKNRTAVVSLRRQFSGTATEIFSVTAPP